MRLSSSSSRVSTFSGWPSQSVQAQNFSTIHAHCASGRVDERVADRLRPRRLLRRVAGLPLGRVLERRERRALGVGEVVERRGVRRRERRCEVDPGHVLGVLLADAAQ